MLVVAIELEDKNEQFRLCFMSQNRGVVENNRVLPVLLLLLIAASLSLRRRMGGTKKLSHFIVDWENGMQVACNNGANIAGNVH